MVMTPTEFYEDLTADIDARRSALSDDEGATFFNRPMTDEELVEWLSFQAYYELAACRFIGSWLADTPERDVMVMLAQQVEDEGLHYEYCMRLLEKRGVTSLDHWTPEPEWVAWIDEWYPSGNDTIERVAAHNFTGELGACDAFLTVKDRVPEDVTISVLTQAREDLIERTVHSLVGIHHANIHLYNALAPLFRRVVFHASKDEVKDIAVRGTTLVMKHSEKLLISSGWMWRCTTSMPRLRASPITVRRVMPSRKQSGAGVWMTPSKTRKRLAPVVSAR